MAETYTRRIVVGLTLLASGAAFVSAWCWYCSALIDLPNPPALSGAVVALSQEFMDASQEASTWNKRGALAAAVSAMATGVAGLLSLRRSRDHG